jgi:hypothetical protein
MTDVEQLQALNAAFIAAVRDSDAAWFDRHLSSDFVNSYPDGRIGDRAGFLLQVARPCPVSSFAVEDVSIQPLGEHAALVRGRTTYIRGDGTPGWGRYTDLWSRDDGEWRCASADVSRF